MTHVSLGAGIIYNMTMSCRANMSNAAITQDSMCNFAIYRQLVINFLLVVVNISILSTVVLGHVKRTNLPCCCYAKFQHHNYYLLRTENTITLFLSATN